MSAVKTLADILNAAQKDTSTEGISNLVANAAGEFQKTGAFQIDTTTFLSDVDLNDIMDMRIVSVLNSCKNIPVFASNMILICIPILTYAVYQIMLRTGDGGMIFFRAYNQTSWQSWQKVSMTVV